MRDRPNLDEFTDAVRKTRGNLTQVAFIFGVTRQTIYNWMKADPEFKEVVSNDRKRLFDECLEVSRIVALGLPRTDRSGTFIGWREKPDGQMLRYLMSTLGKDEGFGEAVNINLENPIPTVINIVKDPDIKREEQHDK